MRAKACNRCRQWKTGCDADVAGPEGCTRCRDANARCVFGANFRRAPKRRMLAELQEEVTRLRAITSMTDTGTGAVDTTSSLETNASPWPEDLTTADMIPYPTTQKSLQPKVLYRGSNNFQLTASQVNELFRLYFSRCYPYLPFLMCRSPEEIHDRCPLLFWVICGVASTEMGRLPCEEATRPYIANLFIPGDMSGTVETVQAFLILCMWPLPFTSQKSDPSFMYGGLASQMALQIGLQRPAVEYPVSDPNFTPEDIAIRTTTWIGCFIVNQILASRLGVPATIFADFSLLSSLDQATVPQQLSHLCSISHLTIESAIAIGARASNASGLADPIPRISLINIFAMQFDELRKTRFPHPTDFEEIFFLSSMLQLWSFAMHNDIPVSADTFHIAQRARQDAIRLVQVACEKNLALVPFYVCRSVCYAALLLYHIKLSPYNNVTDQVLDDHIERAKQALQARTAPALSQFLSTVTSPEHRDEFLARRDRNSSHRWKMGAALMFDSNRAYTHMRQSNAFLFPELIDLDGLFLDVPGGC